MGEDGVDYGAALVACGAENGDEFFGHCSGSDSVLLNGGMGKLIVLGGWQDD